MRSTERRSLFGRGLVYMLAILAISANGFGASAAVKTSGFGVTATVVEPCHIGLVQGSHAKTDSPCLDAPTGSSTSVSPKPVVRYDHDDASGVTWETLEF